MPTRNAGRCRCRPLERGDPEGAVAGGGRQREGRREPGGKRCCAPAAPPAERLEERGVHEHGECRHCERPAEVGDLHEACPIDEGVAEMHRKELRVEPFERDERRRPRERDRPAARADGSVEQRVDRVARGEPDRVCEPERRADRDLAAEEHVDETPEPGVAASVGDEAEDEARQRRGARTAASRRFERGEEHCPRDQRERPDPEADVAEAEEHAAERGAAMDRGSLATRASRQRGVWSAPAPRHIVRTGRGAVGGGLALLVAQRGVGAAAQQQLGERVVALRARQHQRRVAVVIGCVRVGAMVE